MRQQIPNVNAVIGELTAAKYAGQQIPNVNAAIGELTAAKYAGQQISYSYQQRAAAQLAAVG